MKRLIFVLVVLSVACGGGSSGPTTPSAGAATINQRLVLQTLDGQTTTMAVHLMTVKPAPGTAVQLGPSACPSNCFEMNAKFVFGQPEGVTVSFNEALLDYTFSMGQGVEELTFQAWNGAKVGEESLKSSGGPWFIERPWKYLVFRGRYEIILPNFGRQSVVGYAFFSLNYQ